jgi:hypothetical protein
MVGFSSRALLAVPLCALCELRGAIALQSYGGVVSDALLLAREVALALYAVT